MIYTNSLALLEKSLDAASLRQRVTANNIANVDTPFYKSKEVSFEAELTRALQNDSGFAGYRTDPRHIKIGGNRTLSSVQPTVTARQDTVMNNNGNNVDIDYEMSQMAKNALLYQALVQQTNGYFQKMKMVIEGRGR